MLSAEIDKPLTNVVNPQSQRVDALKIEEELKGKKIPKYRMPDKMRTLASLYSDLGQREKAISTLLAALKVNAAPDAGILNTLGILCGEQGDFARQEKFYLEANGHTDWNGPLFNLALSKRRQGKTSDAIHFLDRCLGIQRDASGLVLRAMLAQDQGDDSIFNECLNESINLFGSPDDLADWELVWYTKAARLSGNEENLELARDAQRRRRHGNDEAEEQSGELPKKIGD